MDIRKRNSLLALILGGSTFLTGLGIFVYSSKQLEKVPYVVERTFELEERNSRIDRELRSAITINLRDLTPPDSSLSRIVEKDRYRAQSLTQEQYVLNQEYVKLMEGDEIVKGRESRNNLIGYRGFGVSLGLIGTLPSILGLYNTLSYLTTRRKRSILIRGIPEEDLENQVM